MSLFLHVAYCVWFCTFGGANHRLGKGSGNTSSTFNILKMALRYFCSHPLRVSSAFLTWQRCLHAKQPGSWLTVPRAQFTLSRYSQEARRPHSNPHHFHFSQGKAGIKREVFLQRGLSPPSCCPSPSDLLELHKAPKVNLFLFTCVPVC